MGLFEGILLVSDIDGTLINTQRKVPKQNMDAIEYFIENGGKFTFATGRSIESARLFADIVPLSCPAIVVNGGVIYDYHNNEIIKETFLPESAKHFVKPVMERFPDICTQIHSGSSLFVLSWSEEGRQHIFNEKIAYTEETLQNLMDIPWHKVLYATTPEKIEEIMEFVKTIPCDETYYLRTSPFYFEFMNATVNKGRALLELADILQIEYKNTNAIGDYYNDEQMIDMAAVGAYAENAPDELKQKANYVAAHCDIGAVGDFIQYIAKSLMEEHE